MARRWAMAIWLVLSQLAGVVLLATPTILLATFFAVSSAIDEPLPIMWAGVLVPVLWVLLSLVAWVAFVVKRTTTVLITSAVALIGAAGLLLWFVLGAPAA